MTRKLGVFLVFLATFIVGLTVRPSSQAPFLVFGSSSGVSQVVKATSNALWVSLQSTPTLTVTSTVTLTSLFWSSTAPVATTFCTSPTVPANNGTGAFTISVGTGCATSVGTVTFPAATTSWVIQCHNVTVPASNTIGQTGGTTTTATITNYARTTGLAANWADSNVLRCTAFAY